LALVELYVPLGTEIFARHSARDDATTTLFTMASASLLARTVARRSFDKVLRLKSAAPLGSVRFATNYFTPGELRKMCRYLLMTPEGAP